MEENQNLNSGFHYPQLYEEANLDDDDDLLNQDNQQNEIEDLIQQSHLSILDEDSNSTPRMVPQRQNRSKHVGFKQQDSNELEFERFMREHEIQLNIDSERSQFTQESCSPPESAREQQNVMGYRQMGLKYENREEAQREIQEIIDEPSEGGIRRKRSDMADRIDLQQQTDSFSLMNHNSPSKDSLLGSFQGQVTSSFPQNLRETAQYRLRDPENQLEIKMSDHQPSADNISGSDSNRFNNSYYKFEGQKIKDFEKSTIIKFEEFEGDTNSQLESDPNRRKSERISDRIYERHDNINQKEEEQPFSNYFETSAIEEDKSETPTYQDKNQHLFVITEEEASDEIQSSSYYGYKHLNSGEQRNDQQQFLTSDLFKLNQEQYSREITVQKSKSQPIHKVRASITKSGERIRTDTSPMGNKRQSPTNINTGQNISLYEKQPSRLSHDSLFQPSHNEELSHYFGRLHSGQQLRQNTTHNEFLMSDEDLLSNVDRISKILPTNEISEEDDENHPLLSHKLKEARQKIEQLRYENQNKTTLLMIKDSQMNLLQLKIEELEEQVMKYGAEIEVLVGKRRRDTVDQEIQAVIQNEERKKVRKKQVSSGKVRSPTRVHSQEASQDQSEFGIYLKSTNQQFDTPQLKNDMSLKESPSTSGKRGSIAQKQQSLSFNSDDITQLKQTIAYLKAQLTRSEENNLLLQQKIEKYKQDKNELKEKYLVAQYEKNEFGKLVDEGRKEREIGDMKIEGLKAEILDYRRQIDLYQMKYEDPRNKMDRQVSNSSLQPISDSIAIQTDFLIQQQVPQFQTKLKDKSKQSFAKKDVFIFDDVNAGDVSSTFSSKSLNHNITIINNKQQQPPPPSHPDLNLLLERARDYELISMKLQSEINEHRKALNNNQQRLETDLAQQKDYRRKIRKREAKIDKQRLRIKELEKDTNEMRAKYEEASQRVQDMRIRMESKLQEKEFKIMSLKNQLKHMSNAMPASSGIITPQASSQMVSQKDLYAMINSLIQQQLKQQQQMKVRAKSQEHPYGYIEEPLLVEPRILTPNTYILGDNPSFSDNPFFSQQKDKHYSTPAHISTLKSFLPPSTAIPPTLHQQMKNSQPLQHIFNSSMKRIQQELESIKDFNSSGNNSKTLSKVKESSVMRRSQERQRKVKEEETMYEDSLQTENEVESKIEQIRKQRRIPNDKFRSVKLNTEGSQRKTPNTHTFRQISTQQNNSPNTRGIEIQENLLFTQTQALFQDKEQNASIFSDFKPQFDNSHYTNTSLLNLTSHAIKPPQPVRFESQLQSLNNSVKATCGGIQHFRLNSQLQRETEIEEESSSCGQLSNQQRRGGAKYEDMRGRGSAKRKQQSPRNEGYRSNMSNQSQKLDEIKRKYGRNK